MSVATELRPGDMAASTGLPYRFDKKYGNIVGSDANAASAAAADRCIADARCACAVIAPPEVTVAVVANFLLPYTGGGITEL